MSKMTILLLYSVCLAGCTNEDRSKKALESMGFQEISLDGYAPLACSEDDVYATKFKARNPQGRPVEGTVCCGAFKNCTVRF